MSYEKPQVADFGLIQDHTFTRCGGSAPKVGDWDCTCPRDKFGEASCHTGT